MRWELVNEITGVISAACAVLGVIMQRNAPPALTHYDRHQLLSRRRPASFLLASSGSALCCLCFLLVFEPYGRFISHREYIQFYGVVLCVPALLTLRFGVLLANQEETARTKHIEPSSDS